jgi:hypothetical protein
MKLQSDYVNSEYIRESLNRKKNKSVINSRSLSMQSHSFVIVITSALSINNIKFNTRNKFDSFASVFIDTSLVLL